MFYFSDDISDVTIIQFSFILMAARTNHCATKMRMRVWMSPIRTARFDGHWPLYSPYIVGGHGFGDHDMDMDLENEDI